MCFSKRTKIYSAVSFLVWPCLLVMYAIWAAISEVFALPDMLFHFLCSACLLFHVVNIVGTFILGLYMMIFVSPKSTKKYWFHLMGNVSPLLFVFAIFRFNVQHVVQYVTLPVRILVEDIITGILA